MGTSDTVLDLADTHGVGDPVDQIAERSVLATKIASLPARQRSALVLRFYGGWDDAEIANALGCRAVTVRGYISRALKSLRIEMSTASLDAERTGDAERE